MPEVTATESELLDALEGMHQAVDMLLAELVMHRRSFMPTKSPAWPAMKTAAEILQRYGRL